MKGPMEEADEWASKRQAGADSNTSAVAPTPQWAPPPTHTPGTRQKLHPTAASLAGEQGHRLAPAGEVNVLPCEK